MARPGRTMPGKRPSSHSCTVLARILRFPTGSRGSRLCNTTCVTFHESFWILTGTAAPVIALASVVSLSDLAGQGFRLMDTRRGHPEWWPSREWYQPTYWPRKELRELKPEFVRRPGVKYIDVETDRRLGLLVSFQWVQAVNVCMQAALLSVALLSLAYQTNLVPPWIAVVAAVAGIMLLGVAGWITILGKALYDVEIKDLERFVAALSESKGDEGNEASQDGV
jgi:hypothetical protein